MLGFVRTDNEALVLCLGDPQVRMRAAELVGKFVHSDARAGAALEASRAQDPSAAVRKKAGWFTPGGPIYARTAPRTPR